MNKERMGRRDFLRKVSMVAALGNVEVATTPSKEATFAIAGGVLGALYGLSTATRPREDIGSGVVETDGKVVAFNSLAGGVAGYLTGRYIATHW